MEWSLLTEPPAGPSAKVRTASRTCPLKNGESGYVTEQKAERARSARTPLPCDSGERKHRHPYGVTAPPGGRSETTVRSAVSARTMGVSPRTALARGDPTTTHTPEGRERGEVPMVARKRLVACWTPDYTARLPSANPLAAASALSSGRVLKTIAAPEAILRTALMTTSNNARLRGGRRTPPPMTTQS
jgi:hypothetical protein